MTADLRLCGVTGCREVANVCAAHFGSSNAMLNDARAENARLMHDIQAGAGEIDRLRAAMYQACRDMGCYCADDDPLPDNLKCPICKLEKALHG